MASLSEIWGECVTLNNDGVTLMKELEFRAAYASLTRSLSVAKSIVRYQSDRNDNNATTSSDDGKDLRSPFLDTTPLEPDVGADLRGVYRDAYILSGEGLTDESPRQSEEKRMLVVCAVIIFNLALAHHLEALCNDEHAHLHQALALYELAHAIQRDECMRRNGCGNALHEEFYMALCANLGHIHTIKGHSDQASLCFQNLLSMLVFLQSSQDGERDQHQIKSSARVAFSWCVYAQVLQESSVAPAA